MNYSCNKDPNIEALKWSLKFGASSLEFKVQGLRFRAYSLEFKVHGFEFRVEFRF